MYIVDSVVGSGAIVYTDGPSIIKFASLEVHLRASVPYSNRMVYISAKFVMETSLLPGTARDK
jgi:hypothetical protein